MVCDCHASLKATCLLACLIYKIVLKQNELSVCMRFVVLFCCLVDTSMQKLPNFFKRKTRTSEEREDQETPMDISGPTNVTHDCHVGFDSDRGTFTGLPMAWAQWLQEANIR